MQKLIFVVLLWLTFTLTGHAVPTNHPVNNIFLRKQAQETSHLILRGNDSYGTGVLFKLAHLGNSETLEITDQAKIQSLLKQIQIFNDPSNYKAYEHFNETDLFGGPWIYMELSPNRTDGNSNVSGYLELQLYKHRGYYFLSYKINKNIQFRILPVASHSFYKFMKTLRALVAQARHKQSGIKISDPNVVLADKSMLDKQKDIWAQSKGNLFFRKQAREVSRVFMRGNDPDGTGVLFPLTHFKGYETLDITDQTKIRFLLKQIFISKYPRIREDNGYRHLTSDNSPVFPELHMDLSLKRLHDPLQLGSSLELGFYKQHDCYWLCYFDNNTSHARIFPIASRSFNKFLRALRYLVAQARHKQSGIEISLPDTAS